MIKIEFKDENEMREYFYTNLPFIIRGPKSKVFRCPFLTRSDKDLFYHGLFEALKNKAK